MANAKVHRFYETQSTPAMGGMPAVASEIVYVIRREPSLGAGWFHVRFANGSRLCMSESRFVREA